MTSVQQLDAIQKDVIDFTFSEKPGAKSTCHAESIKQFFRNRIQYLYEILKFYYEQQTVTLGTFYLT